MNEELIIKLSLDELTDEIRKLKLKSVYRQVMYVVLRRIFNALNKT